MGRRRTPGFIRWTRLAIAAVVVVLLASTPALGSAIAAPILPAPPASFARSIGGGPDWTTYLHDVERSGFSAALTTPNPGNVSKLALVWSRAMPNATDGSVIVVNGSLYAGSEGGYLYALNASTGRPLPGWTAPFLGSSSNYSHCENSGTRISLDHGITSTATWARGKLWENGGDNTFYEIGSDGAILHSVDVGNSSTAKKWYFDYLWSNPLIENGHAYVGTAALCEYEGYPNTYGYTSDFRYIQGQLLDISLASDSIVQHFNVTVSKNVSDTGGSVWASPTYDPATNTVWIATGNANQSYQVPANRDYPQSIVALNATSLALRGGCQVVSAATASYSADDDFGATPTLFHDAKGNSFVGAVNKDGVFYAINATSFTRGSTNCTGGSLKMAWTETLLGSAGYGTVSPAAWDGSRLFLASGGAGTGLPGYVQALGPDGGKDIWSFKMSSPFACIAYGALTVAGGVVYVDAVGQGTSSSKGVLFALDAKTGAELMKPIVFNQTIAGPPVVAEGKVFVETGSLSFTGTGFVDAFAA